jgi:hypothetical protein
MRKESRMKELLQSIFCNVNDWLKYAEAKNAAFLAFLGAAIFCILQVIPEKSDMSLLILLYFGQLLIFFSAAVVVVLLSFTPIIRIPKLIGRQKEHTNENLLFYGDIVNYDSRGYLEAVSKSYCIDYDKNSKLLFDYAEQIIVNSQIAIRKYVAFNISIWLGLAGLTTPIVAIGIYLLFKR